MKLRLILLPLMLLVLALGLVRLFYLRFAPGDVYPPYSTLRADPVGSKALYAAYEAAGVPKLERNLKQLPKIDDPAHTTMFLLGVRRWGLGWTARKEVEVIEKFLTEGGTLVVAFTPVKPGAPAEKVEKPTVRRQKKTPKQSDEKSWEEVQQELKDKEKEKDKQKKPDAVAETKQEEGKPADKDAKAKVDVKKDAAKEEEEEEDAERRRHYVELDKSWDIDWITAEKPEKKKTKDGKEASGEESTAEDDSEAKEDVRDEFPWANLNPGFSGTLPSRLRWHSALGFKPVPDKWYPVYTIDDRVVVAARDRGKGRIILVSDAYLLSNEGLRADPQPALLAWLAGASTHLVFDESHHGISENPGVASLARRYRLEGLAAGVILLFLLFIWKNAVSFVPRVADVVAEDRITGRDAFSGLVNLLYRHLPSREALETGLREWEKSFQHRRTDAAEKVAAARQFLQDNPKASAVDCYRKICSILERK